MTARARSDRRLDGAAQRNPHRDSPPGFLGYHANGQRGLEGAHRATETSCVPLLENQAVTGINKYSEIGIVSAVKKESGMQ